MVNFQAQNNQEISNFSIIAYYYACVCAKEKNVQRDCDISLWLTVFLCSIDWITFDRLNHWTWHVIGSVSRPSDRPWSLIKKQSISQLVFTKPTISNRIWIDDNYTPMKWTLDAGWRNQLSVFDSQALNLIGTIMRRRTKNRVRFNLWYFSKFSKFSSQRKIKNLSG